ncbi:MAG: hypothetical protein KJ950_13740 [Proteobacteria bacterium]|nr:hypothetical protein [Pseudomonadota bacterium]MBU1686072.1 hypothetical protein [Pseudomonadota bacterium]
MKIDITQNPPADLFRKRRPYIRVATVLLVLVLCGVSLGLYGIFTDKPYGVLLEDVALGLFVVPSIIFVYFGGKLQAYKKLSVEQTKELDGFRQDDPVIDAYCAKVVASGRKPVMAEYEACKDRVEDREFKEQ